MPDPIFAGPFWLVTLKLILVGIVTASIAIALWALLAIDYDAIDDLFGARPKARRKL